MRLCRRRGAGSPDCLQPNDDDATREPADLIQPRRVSFHLVSGKPSADCEIPEFVVTIVVSAGSRVEPAPGE
jgi:hypothetical protein